MGVEKEINKTQMLKKCMSQKVHIWPQQKQNINQTKKLKSN